jgi:quercetin dioxygenase-like cupin family protein
MNCNDHLLVVRLPELPLGEFGYADDATARVRGAFPFSAATGNKNTAMVCVEIEPGNYLATHTDSAEEILVILAGEAEVTVGDQHGRVTAGDMALVPAMVPHAVRNTGSETVRMLGIFSSNTVMSTFDQPLLPLNLPPMSPLGERTVLTPLPIALEAVAGV